MAGTISSVGIGTSGLDVNAIITKLVELEKAPLSKLQAQNTLITTRISAYSQIKSLSSALSDAALNLALSTTWKAVSTTSSDTSAVQVTTSGSVNPATGAFSVQVQQLAKAQSASTDSFAVGGTVGAGSLQIQLGTWSAGGSAFTPAGADAVSVAVSATDSLGDIAAKINAAGAGVTATVLTDASGQRLLVRSNATGEASGFRIQATEDGVAEGDPDPDVNTGLSRLAFDPQSGAFGMASAANATSLTYGQNANATINNIAVTSTSNTFTDTIPGLSITVAKETTAAVNLTIAADKATMAKSVQSFVDAYNALNTFIAVNTKYDATNKQATLLQGDSTAVGIQKMLRNLIGSVTTGGAFERLSDVGVAFQQDGSLTVDNTKLNAALTNNLAGVQNLFSADNGDTQTNGFGLKLKAFMSGMLAASGTIATRTTALQADATRNTQAQDKVNAHVALVQTRLEKRYTALDTQMASLSALSAYVNQQVALWNKSKN
jgi:flagellar hook-associated protein 2